MITSKKTSVNQLPAIAKLVEEFHGWKSKTTNLDIGAGKYNKFTDYLEKKGVRNFPYDLYNRTDKENKTALRRKYHTITMSNVLCVIKDKKVRKFLIQLAKSKLRKDGKVYITIYEGDKSGVGCITREDCWQENKRTIEYVDEIFEVFTTVSIKGKLIIAT